MENHLPIIRNYGRTLSGVVLLAMLVCLTPPAEHKTFPGTKYYAALNETLVPQFEDLKRISFDPVTKDSNLKFTVFSFSTKAVNAWLAIPMTYLVSLSARNCFYVFITVSAP